MEKPMYALVYTYEGYYNSAPYSVVIAISNDIGVLRVEMQKCIDSDIVIDEDDEYNEEKNFELIPVGDYRLRIADVVEKTFKSGNPGYEITMDVSGHASKVWFYLVLDSSNPAQTNQRLGEFFDSFGIGVFGFCYHR